MAARSFSITVLNFKGKAWQRTNIALPHGEWSNNGGLVPPEVIPAQMPDANGDSQPGVAFFEAESQGAGTGCEGFVDYSNELGTMSIHFDNPFVGSNGFNTSGPNETCRFLWGDPGGNDANITLQIQKR